MNLSNIVDKKSKQIKDIHGEYALIQNEIGILTQALKNQKKENRIVKAAMDKQQKLVGELITLVKQEQKQPLHIKDKIKEIELSMNQEPKEEVEKIKILKDKDGKSMASVVSPVIKKTYEKPINSQDIFHKT